MIQIRNQSFVAHGEKPDAVPEAIVIPLQFPFACAENREIPVAHKLHDEPESKDSEKNPPSERLKAVKGNDAKGVQAEHGKLGASGSDAFHKKVFSDSVCDGASQEPYP